MTEQADNTAITQDERIAHYLRGEMSPDEERAFLEELKQHDELRIQAITTARLVKAMRHVGAERDWQVVGSLAQLHTKEELKAKLATITTGQPVATATRHVSLSRKTATVLSAAAATLLLFMGGYRLYDNHQMSRLGATYLACFPASEYDRGADADAQATINQLYQAVASQKDLPATIADLEQAWRLARQAEYNDYTEYKPLIGWMLANAYVLHNDKERAVAILDALIQDPDCTAAMVSKAQELKQKIEDQKPFGKQQ